MGKIYWTGICSRERNEAISAISTIINRHGCFTDFKLFSDVSLGMVIEVEERIVLLNVTFTRGTGNLEREVPAVPG
jgi:hypothetical protein